MSTEEKQKAGMDDRMRDAFLLFNTLFIIWTFQKVAEPNNEYGDLFMALFGLLVMAAVFAILFEARLKQRFPEVFSG